MFGFFEGMEWVIEVDRTVTLLHNETIENFQQIGGLIVTGSGRVFEDWFVTSLQYDMRVFGRCGKQYGCFPMSDCLFESITEQAQMMAWTGRLLKIKYV